MGWILNSKRGRRVGRIGGDVGGDWNFVLLFWGRVAAWVTEPSGRRVDAMALAAVALESLLIPLRFGSWPLAS
jgi:hypothetical protein